MKSRVVALWSAQSDRLCPPPGLCNLPEHSERCEQHRRSCPICSFITRKDDAPLCGQEKPVPIQPAQVWRIRPDMGLWRDFNYYSPPRVFVLGESENAPGAVRVAQVYKDFVLAAPGDLILEEDRTAGLDPFFIEAWNVYSLRCKDLGQLLAQLDEEVLDAVLRLVENPEDYPRWALFPRSIRDPTDKRVFFRKMEEEVGRVFSSGDSILLSKDTEAIIFRNLDYASADDLLNDLSSFPVELPKISFPSLKEKKPVDILFMVEPVLLAAAPSDEENDTGDTETLTAVAFVVRAGRITDSFPVSVKVTGHLWENSHLNLTGELADKDCLDPNLRWIWVFRWLCGGSVLLEPLHEETGQEEGTFWVTFDFPNSEVTRNGKLHIRIFGERQ